MVNALIHGVIPQFSMQFLRACSPEMTGLNKIRALIRLGFQERL